MIIDMGVVMVFQTINLIVFFALVILAFLIYMVADRKGAKSLNGALIIMSLSLFLMVFVTFIYFLQLAMGIPDSFFIKNIKLIQGICLIVASFSLAYFVYALNKNYKNFQ